MSKDDEKVLCIPRTSLVALCGGDLFQGAVSADRSGAPLLTKLLASPDLQFVARRDCETNPALKQLIPYVVVTSRCYQVSHILLYNRAAKGGEDRLAGKQTIGIGGHINDTDHAAGDFFATFTNGWQREVAEEVELASSVPPYRFAGYVNNDSNAVGAVHFGVVISLDVPVPFVKANTPDIVQPHFVPYHAVRQLTNLEDWSNLVARDLLADLF
jgi:predicted NUDIX family phosphoesterase